MPFSPLPTQQPGFGVGEERRLRLVKPSVDYVQRLKFPTGNYPPCIGDSRDLLVHWCHGSPGVIYMLLQAHKVRSGALSLQSLSGPLSVQQWPLVALLMITFAKSWFLFSFQSMIVALGNKSHVPLMLSYICYAVIFFHFNVREDITVYPFIFNIIFSFVIGDGGK